MAPRTEMEEAGEALIARPGDRVPDALAKLSRNGLGRLAVLDNWRLTGYLSLRDVLHVLAVSTARGVDDRVQAGAARSDAPGVVHAARD